MASSPLRSGGSEKRGVRLDAKGNAVARFVSRPTGRECVLGEEVFCAMLALERRRAERSRKPFVLMLIDTRGCMKNADGTVFARQISHSVSSAVRESDLIGWYQENAVLGVIFTEINLDVQPPLMESLQEKVQTALVHNLGQKHAANLVVTIHLFPEALDHGLPNRVADTKLYPDVSRKASKKPFHTALKRAMDIAGSCFLLLLFAPLLAAIAVAIKLTSKGSVIYKQERLGQFGKSFECLKFRTMYADNDPKIHREYIEDFIAGKAENHAVCEDEPVVYKLRNDPRVTPVGRFLRKTSLDEFPQFWNVLRAEMSLVGPRPPLPYEFQAYDFWHRRRVFEARPGVTGLWQVSGRSRTSFNDMVRMDLQYVQQWSLWLDLKILLVTPLAVFVGGGAY